jgi:hypothetical protein
VSELTAEIRLRPTRIGFLVRPSDLASVRSIMRVCTCLWGGAYNPIIPVFARPPPEWKPDAHEQSRIHVRITPQRANISPSLDQADHPDLRFRILVDVSLRGPEVRVPR